MWTYSYERYGVSRENQYSLVIVMVVFSLFFVFNAGLAYLALYGYWVADEVSSSLVMNDKIDICICFK